MDNDDDDDSKEGGGRWGIGGCRMREEKAKKKTNE